jgi:hypothetical protein
MGALISQRIVALGLVGLALAACQAIAGIEDRKLDPEASIGGTGGAPSEQCETYCTTVMDACAGKNAVYASTAHCLSVCGKLEPGDPGEPVGNTVECRLRQAKIAKTSEPEETCRFAGPGGDDVCGSDCEAYCTLYPQICPDKYAYESEASCLQACSGLTDQHRYNLDADHGGDTIECRLVHTASASIDPVGHCKHGPIPQPEEWCNNPPDDAPTCKEYCKLELAACDGVNAQYESEQQCLDVCAALDPGNNADTTGNTVGCRRYHSFNATLGAATHCPHAGPTGDGHCGDPSYVKDGHTGNCESYCKLVETACATQFAATLGNAEDCMTTCIGLDEAERDSGYTVATAKTSTGLNCRVLHTARALGGDDTACDAAVGATPCE